MFALVARRLVHVTQPLCNLRVVTAAPLSGPRLLSCPPCGTQASWSRFHYSFPQNISHFKKNKQSTVTNSK